MNMLNKKSMMSLMAGAVFFTGAMSPYIGNAAALEPAQQPPAAQAQTSIPASSQQSAAATKKTDSRTPSTGDLQAIEELGTSEPAPQIKTDKTANPQVQNKTRDKADTVQTKDKKDKKDHTSQVKNKKDDTRDSKAQIKNTKDEKTQVKDQKDHQNKNSQAKEKTDSQAKTLAAAQPSVQPAAPAAGQSIESGKTIQPGTAAASQPAEPAAQKTAPVPAVDPTENAPEASQE